MNGAVHYITMCGKLICFFGDRFPTTDLSAVEASTVSYSSLVFFQQRDFFALEDKLPHIPAPVDVCLVGCVSTELLEYLQELQKAGRIRRTLVSIADVYKALPFTDVSVGAEKWDNMGTPDGLCELDYSVVNVGDVQKLLPSIEHIVDEIAGYRPTSDLERILLVDLWLQRNVQYIKGRESQAQGGIYLCEDMNRESLAEDVILHHFGRCEDIAFTAAMILNHPRISVPCRQVSASRIGFNHSWNIITLEESDYYTDFTHNITRNPDLVPNALKARSYSPQFTLLGVRDALSKYGTTNEYHNDYFSIESYDRAKIEITLNKLTSMGISLSWDDHLVMDSILLP